MSAPVIASVDTFGGEHGQPGRRLAELRDFSRFLQEGQAELLERWQRREKT